MLKDYDLHGGAKYSRKFVRFLSKVGSLSKNIQFFWFCVFAAPLYYKEYYHLFYQYNPHGPVWGNLTWAHAVSKDLVHWLYLEDVLKPDQWYDVMGVWSGSATIDPDGIPFILYTGQLKPNFW
jgi:hypothetical protein